MLSFFKKPTEIDKVRKEIKNVEFKKNSIAPALASDKNMIQGEIGKVYTEIGSYIHTSFKNGDTNYDCSSYLDRIVAFENEIEEKVNKSIEMEARYSEELSMLQSSLATLEAEAAAAKAAEAEAKAEAARLKAEAKAEAKAQTTPVAPVQTTAAFCPSCGKAVSTDDAFCQACGNKI